MAEATSITTGTLIAAEKVRGTSVYNLAGDKLGSVEDIMIDKVSGRAIYAVMSFGGFLGMGEEHYPLPWATLKYDVQKGGYMVNLDKKQLEGAPSYARGSEFKWTPDYGRKVDSFYKVPSAWGCKFLVVPERVSRLGGKPPGRDRLRERTGALPATC